MKKSRKKKKVANNVSSSPPEQTLTMSVVNPHAGAADLGSREHFVCVGLNRSEDVRTFGCSTAELNSLADWLELRGVTAFAMESTGHYWYALYDILTKRNKMTVMLVNGRFSKNISGRKTDILDSEWLYKLHSFGLLRGSFLTDSATEYLKTLARHRQVLVAESARRILRVNKSLRRMNLVVDSVLSNLQTLSSLRIIEAIIRGERDAEVLADMASSRVKSSREKRVAALTGNWRDCDVLAIAQNYEAYCLFVKQIEALDLIINAHLAKTVGNTEGGYQPFDEPQKATKGKKGEKKGEKKEENTPTEESAYITLNQRSSAFEKEEAATDYPTALERIDPFKQRAGSVFKTGVQLDFDRLKRDRHQHEAPFDIQGYAFKIWGVDLFAIPGVGRECVLSLLSEIGPPINWQKFSTAGHFSSWLGLLPNNKISGGKVLSSHRVKHSNRVTVALRNGVANIMKSNVTKNTPLHKFAQRMVAKKGKSSAIVAVAGKVARIIWHMVTKQEAYHTPSAEVYEAKIGRAHV